MSETNIDRCACADEDACPRYACLFGGAITPHARSLCRTSAPHRAAWDAEEAKLRAAGCDPTTLATTGSDAAQPAPAVTIQELAATAREPGFWMKALNYARSTVRHAASGFKAVSEEVYQKRLALCRSCRYHDPEKDTCRICGCPSYGTPLGDKLRRASESCPATIEAHGMGPRWGPEESLMPFDWVAPIGAGGWRGRMSKKPWEYQITAILPFIDTLETLPVVIELLRLQTVRPYIIVVDTGSDAPVRDELEKLRGADLEVHYIRAGAYVDSSAPVSAALDLAFSLVATEHVFNTHADCFLRRRDYLEWLRDRCDATTPVVGYEMSPRDGTDAWQGIPSHTASLYHMPTVRRHRLHWSMPHCFELLGIPPASKRRTWPDTESVFGMLMKECGLTPLLIGRETNWERFVDNNVDHVRTYPGGKLYAPAHFEKMREPMKQALAEARERIELWKKEPMP